MALAERGCTVDITAFPVEEGEDAWSAEEALVRYLDAGLPAGRVTVSSDGGGCLPVFDAEGRVVAHRCRGAVRHAATTLARAASAAGSRSSGCCPRSPAIRRACSSWSGRAGSRPGADADLVVLDGTARWRT